VPAGRFSLGAEGSGGTFRRQASRFREWVSSDGSTPYPAEPGRYHLYVSWACPWAHRTIIARRLMGLEDVIGMSVVDPIRDERGWAFTGGPYTDPVNGWAFLSEAYAATDPGYEGRVSVPVLWDTRSGRIVSNESGDILRMLGTGFGGLADPAAPDLYPEPLRPAIDALDERIYDTVNNAVYKAGFTARQDVYEREVRGLFATLSDLDARLAERRYLFGDAPVETDWRLFTTLVRLDPVYYVHFKCCLRRLTEFRNLWPYARDLFQRPGVAETVRPDEFRAHYYRTHPMVNPSGLVALEPEADWHAPHGRERVGAVARAA
jgi:glutathionyl-hydroquinone reductase